jgi:hypothetical protein
MNGIDGVRQLAGEDSVRLTHGVHDVKDVAGEV